MPSEKTPSGIKHRAGKSEITRFNGSRYRMTDAHLHVLNFRQEMPDPQSLVRAMDRCGVEKAVIFGLPVVKIWAEFDREAPDYYLSSDSRCYYYSLTDVMVHRFVNTLPKKQQHRFYPLFCGFNPVDKFAIRDVERIYNMFPGFWRGIGEILLRHDDLTALTYGDTPRINHKALYPIFEFAGEKKLPVLVHHNISSVANPHYPVYVFELEEVLRDFPNTTMVFAHCGISRRINVPFYYKMIERLLGQYPNLHIDISWIILDEVICPSGIPDKNWVRLLKKYSGRCCLGSDLVTRFERLGIELSRYDPLLDMLGEEAVLDICTGTAEKLYGKQ